MLDFVGDKEARHNLLLEAAVFKIVNRQKYLETSQDGVVAKDDVIVSLLADLQQEQDQESEKLVNDLQDKVRFSHLYLVTLAINHTTLALRCFYFPKVEIDYICKTLTRKSTLGRASRDKCFNKCDKYCSLCQTELKD